MAQTDNDIVAIFSDVDGTVVHYEKSMVKQGYRLVEPKSKKTAPEGMPYEQCLVDGERAGLAVQRICWRHVPTSTDVWCLRVPSLTLGGGFISEATLDLVDELRARHGVYFILMTGARTSTLLMRRQSGTLPTTEFDVGEGGGKIWARRGAPPEVPAPLEVAWTEQFVPVAGPMEQLDTDPLSRVGALWDVFRILHADGFHLDAKSFSTSFLVDLGKSRVVVSGELSVDQAEAELKKRFAIGEEAFERRYRVTYVTNLGKGQVCPVGCNKKAALEYISNVLKIPTVSAGGGAVRALAAVALFDDENDLEFARCCALGFIPSVAHASVVDMLNGELQEAAAKGHTADALRWRRTPVEGPLGTEHALRAILEMKATQAATRVVTNADRCGIEASACDQ